MKEEILNIIEEEIQNLRAEISNELIKMSEVNEFEYKIHNRNSIILVSQVNKLREIKRIINEKIK